MGLFNSKANRELDDAKDTLEDTARRHGPNSDEFNEANRDVNTKLQHASWWKR